MSSKYGVLNILLGFLVLFLSFESYDAWNHSWQPVTGVLSETSGAKNADPGTEASVKESGPVNSYNAISEKNIFNPERIEFSVPATPNAAGAPQPIVRPQIVLYGVAIAGSYEAATISNPERTLGNGEREVMTVKVGRNIGGYRVTQILPDRISLENNGDAFQVLLDDIKRPKKRMEAKTNIQLAGLTSPLPDASLSGEAPATGAPSPQSVQELKEPIRTSPPRPLPFNKHTYQLLMSSAAANGGKVTSESFLPGAAPK